MRIIALGSAAGGGSPQWNCRCRVCDLAWNGDSRVSRRTQASLAVSANEEDWCLLNCSPDIREQISVCNWLKPRGKLRGSPIRDIVLTSGEVDHVGGLLSLRENEPYSIFGSAEVLELLEANQVYEVLDRRVVSRQAIASGETVTLGSGITVELFQVQGKAPLYLERGAPTAGAASDFTVGARIAAQHKTFFYIPGCAAIDEDLAGRIRGAQLVFFDGTLWTDDEMIASGTGRKTGRRMGHMPVSGADGSLHTLSSLGIGRLIYTHINNTNPMLIDGSPERRDVEAAKAEVAFDGMEIIL